MSSVLGSIVLPSALAVLLVRTDLLWLAPGLFGAGAAWRHAPLLSRPGLVGLVLTAIPVLLFAASRFVNGPDIPVLVLAIAILGAIGAFGYGLGLGLRTLSRR